VAQHHADGTFHILVSQEILLTMTRCEVHKVCTNAHHRGQRNAACTAEMQSGAQAGLNKSLLLSVVLLLIKVECPQPPMQMVVDYLVQSEQVLEAVEGDAGLH